MDRDTVVRLDKAHVWHPYTPMDDYVTNVDPIVVRRAKGSWLEDVDGHRYLDGNSSWWVASLGHGHPRLLKTLARQAEELVHCSLAGIAHENAAALAKELIDIAPHANAGGDRLSRVFYTDNGSTSIEVAVKIAAQAWLQRGAPKKTRFVALEGAFHGDSLGATSLGGVEVFRKPFASLVFDCVHVPSPAEGGHTRAFEAVSRALSRASDEIAAVVVEPMVQGAAGMRVYDAAYLRALRDECRARDVLLVVDEVFTGYGRTGPMWACDHAAITPDIVCLGKAFASLLPMGATLVTESLFDAFRGKSDRALYYGHTFCGHPLGAALAREVLAIYRDEDVLGQVARKSKLIARAFDAIAHDAGVLRTRSIGMIGAADLDDAGSSGYLARIGWRVYEEARARGAYLRPLGNTVYVCPPLTIDERDLESLLAILRESIATAVRSAAATAPH